MLTSWLAVTALLAASASPAATERGPLTVAATCRVKGHPELELTLNCGHGGNTGVVQFWHTPFGDLRAPGPHSELDPVFMHPDGSLVVPNSSSLHSGLYYCLLQHTEGTTLWPYQLHVGSHHQENQEHENQEHQSQDQEHQSQDQDSSCRTLRVRRSAASEEEEQPGGVSDGELAGAVAASVLLTFVFGFSAGALSRAHVLRCLGAIPAKLRTLRPPAVPHRDPELSMNTLTSMYHNEATETTTSSTHSSPPVKPQRSFRLKREEQQDITAYLEGCDNTKEEKRGMEEQEEQEVEDKAGRSLEENKEGKKEEEREVTVLYQLGENGGSRSETDEVKYSDNGEERDGGSREEEKDAGEKENSRREDEERRGSEQEVEGNREKENEETEGAEGEMDKDISQQSETEDEELDRRTSEEMQGGIMGGGGGAAGGGGGRGGEASSSPPCSARRSRIIRLYQYDEDGHRYSHLPDPAPDEPVPAPRLKQRSLSLTRLNAIMAAASAGPLDGGETRGEGQEERPHFHMEI